MRSGDESGLNRFVGMILSAGIILVLLYLIFFVFLSPKHARGAGIQKNAICPFDGASAWYTRQQWVTPEGVTECQYKHIRFRINNQGLVVEEPHIFWIECKEE